MYVSQPYRRWHANAPRLENYYITRDNSSLILTLYLGYKQTRRARRFRVARPLTYYLRALIDLVQGRDYLLLQYQPPTYYPIPKQASLLNLRAYSYRRPPYPLPIGDAASYSYQSGQRLSSLVGRGYTRLQLANCDIVFRDSRWTYNPTTT